MYHWSTHQLTEYLVSVSNPQDPAAAIQVALERATEALDAELGAVLIDGELRGSVGFGQQGVPGAFLAAVQADEDLVHIPGIGQALIVRGALGKVDTSEPASQAWLIVGRLDEEYTAEEQQMLQGMSLVLGLVLHNLDALETERSRHRLVETLLAIQRAISARRPLKELLDAITEGASALLGGCPVALLLTDPAAPGALLPASVFNYPDLCDAALTAVQRMMGPTCVAEDHVQDPAAVGGGVLAERVVVGGEPAGCLVARSDHQGVRRRDQGELLTAFAQQVSLALTDARTLDAVREAYHDSITGLPNRALFLQRLEKARRSTLARDDDLTILFIDLDRFKAVNDTLGHQAGDELLGEVGRRIMACLRPDDTAARLGGDEFSVLLEHADLAAGDTVAQRIIRALTRAFVISSREVFIGASVGLASLTAAHVDAAALLSDADIAMYAAKRSGRGRSMVFEPHMHQEAVDRLNLRTDIQHATTNGQLWLAYQPILRLHSLQLEGVEALMRWDHPTRGAVPPKEFIPIAEESDVIRTLGEWACRRGMAEAARWLQESPSLRLSLNISARQIADPTLPGVVATALASSGLPADAVTLEITESLLMEDPDMARVRLAALKDLGVRLAIDDFGTGYSSLAYLRQFPVDQVKIDRSFVTRLKAGARDDIAVVRSVIELCGSLRLQTVAEGIETSEQLEILAELGCDLGQGYHFARPMSPDRWPDYARAVAVDAHA